MNEKIYKLIFRRLKDISHGVEFIIFLNKLITAIVYLTYPAFLFILIANKDIRFWKVLFIPAICFLLVSWFRAHINFPRPYELLKIEPLIKKDTKGKSFPSRHVSSIFVIAMTLYYISRPVAILLILMGIMLGLIRVVVGVHFPRDVIVGAIIGILFGILGWNLFLF